MRVVGHLKPVDEAVEKAAIRKQKLEQAERHARLFAELLEWAAEMARGEDADKAEALIVGEILAASEAVHGKDAVDAANLLGDALKAAAKRIHG